VYVVTGTVETPVLNPPAGTYTEAQVVSITCATAGAQIRYTTNGTEPTASSPLYTGPLTITTTTTIKAKGFLTNWTPSATVTGVYTITGTVATPTFNPPAGTYQTAQNVSISCATPGATIRYTTDGTDPTATSTIYTAPIACPLNSSTTIKAKAFKTDWTPSTIASATYVITGMVATPALNPPAGTYQTAQSVSITCATAGATIRYTTNGTDPTETSTIYTAPIACPLNATTVIKARGFLTNWSPSPVTTGIYVITGTVAAPEFNPPAGDYDDPIAVQISCSTPGAEIRYTTDDSEPTAASTLYTAPISIDQDTTIKAKAFMPDWTPSPTVTAVYNISSAVGDEHAVPLYTGIHGVYPNPFSAQTTIRMGFKEANSTYSLRIFNIRGEMVFQTNGHATGYADYNWNGCDNRGSRLSAGIYLVSLQSNGTTQTRKLVLK
jgi:N-acetyl-beta-hexosaminidase